MSIDDSERVRPARSTGRGVRRAVPPRRAARAQGVHRPLPGAGRRDPRAVPGAGQGRAGRGDLAATGTSRADAGAATTAAAQVGDYRILREIGRGGMGVVYEAEQVSLGRRVALKVLPRQVSGDRTVLERFRREARAAARLHHTNIVPVFEVGQDGDVRFYAMQFIQGQGLDLVIDELRRLAEPVAVRPSGDRRARPTGGRRRPARRERDVGRVAGSLAERPVRDRSRC